MTSSTSSTVLLTTAKDRALSVKTLICFLQTLIGQKTWIELKNDYQLLGTVDQVDAYMNVELSDVSVRKPVNLVKGDYHQYNLDYMFIKGTRVRYVSVPDEIDVIENINQGIEKIRNHHTRRVTSSTRRAPKAVIHKDNSTPNSS
ncbi:U6 snRNA-associated Sm-like protein LSm2 [Panonychus citri]|uniref:U6 snRNA-associated Sm-like protein LSm2 n=1 Tax=Panonychus citri TaxID=50023 RepID=UPI00230739D1|nr:U6 snRNA-associated Sm-like protein LSm2 [Panonychus citri]